MKPSSAKNKGRCLQKLVCAALLSVSTKLGLQLEPDDIKSTSMGASGVDVQLSPAARHALGNLAIECKNVESLNVTSVFWSHAAKYPKHFNLLVHKRNHTEPLVTMKLSDYVKLLEEAIG